MTYRTTGYKVSPREEGEGVIKYQMRTKEEQEEIKMIGKKGIINSARKFEERFSGKRPL